MTVTTEYDDFEKFLQTFHNDYFTFDNLFLNMDRHNLMVMEKEEKLPEELKSDEQSINTTYETDNILLPTIFDSDDHVDIDALISLYIPSGYSNQMLPLLD